MRQARCPRKILWLPTKGNSFIYLFNSPIVVSSRSTIYTGLFNFRNYFNIFIRRQAFPADEKTSRIFKDGDDVYFTLKGDVRKESNNTSLPVVSATTSQQRPQNKYSTPQYSAPVSTPSHVNPSPSHEATPSMDSYIDEGKIQRFKLIDPRTNVRVDLDEPDSRPMYSESQPYGRKKQLVLVDELPAEEALSTSCCICGEMLQYKRKDKSVQCHYCKGINLPVTVGTSLLNVE